MFSKRSDELPGSPQPANGRSTMSGKSTFSVLGSDLRIKGDISASADLHIDGTVEGDIACTALVLTYPRTSARSALRSSLPIMVLGRSARTVTALSRSCLPTRAFSHSLRAAPSLSAPSARVTKAAGVSPR